MPANGQKSIFNKQEKAERNAIYEPIHLRCRWDSVRNCFPWGHAFCTLCSVCAAHIRPSYMKYVCIDRPTCVTFGKGNSFIHLWCFRRDSLRTKRTFFFSVQSYNTLIFPLQRESWQITQLHAPRAHFWLCAKLNSGVNNEHFYAFPHSPEQNLKYWGANRRHLHFPDYGTARKTHAEQQVLSSVCLSVNKLILKYQMLMVWPFFNAFSSLFSLLFKIHIPSKSFLTLQLLPTWNRQTQRDWKHFQCHEFIWF